jgi:hypothetical protein
MVDDIPEYNPINFALFDIQITAWVRAALEIKNSDPGKQLTMVGIQAFRFNKHTLLSLPSLFFAARGSIFEERQYELEDDVEEEDRQDVPPRRRHRQNQGSMWDV